MKGQVLKVYNTKINVFKFNSNLNKKFFQPFAIPWKTPPRAPQFFHLIPSNFPSWIIDFTQQKRQSSEIKSMTIIMSRSENVKIESVAISISLHLHTRRLGKIHQFFILFLTQTPSLSLQMRIGKIHITMEHQSASGNSITSILCCLHACWRCQN